MKLATSFQKLLWEVKMFTEEYKEEYKKEYRKQIGGKDDDLEKALEVAHRIREFEIELYWKRTAYLWAIQAALIAIAAFASNGGDTNISIADQSITFTVSASASSLAFLCLVSSLGMFVATLWVLLLKGAKFWQDNWERHVDLLEELVGLNLYKTYPVQGRTPTPPFSVTKVNNYIAFVFCAFWVLVTGSALYRLVDLFCASQMGTIVYFCFAVLIYTVVLLFFINQFCHSTAFNGLHMSDFGKQVFPKEGNTSPSIGESQKLRIFSRKSQGDS